VCVCEGEGGREIEKEREHACVIFFVYFTVDVASVLIVQ
jgi:hypothetical protein